MEDTKQDLKPVFEKLKELRTELGLTGSTSLKLTTNYVINSESKKVEELHELESFGSPEELDKILQFEKAGKDLYSSFSVQVTLKVGDRIPKTFGEVSRVPLAEGQSDEKVEFSQREGEVLLIDIWATWCGPCQAPMAHNQKMLEENQEKWAGGKVRIVGVSVDDDSEKLIKRIKDKGWTAVDHYKLNGWDGNHNLIKYFKVRGIPHVVLVKRNGVINYIGHPSSTNLEERINKLLEQVEEQQTADKNAEQKKDAEEDEESPKKKQLPITAELFEKQKALLQNEVQALIQSEFNDYDGVLKFTLTLNQELKKGESEQQDTYQALNILVSGDQKYEGAIKHLETLVKEHVSREQYQGDFVVKDPKQDFYRNIKYVGQLLTQLDLKSIRFSAVHQKKFAIEGRNLSQLKIASKTLNYLQQQGESAQEITAKQKKDFVKTIQQRFEEQRSLGIDVSSLETLLEEGLKVQVKGKPFKDIKGVYVRGDAEKKVLDWQSTLAGAKTTIVWLASQNSAASFQELVSFVTKAAQNLTTEEIAGLQVVLLNFTEEKENSKIENLNRAVETLTQHNIKHHLLHYVEERGYMQQVEDYGLNQLPFIIVIDSHQQVYDVLNGKEELQKYALADKIKNVLAGGSFDNSAAHKVSYEQAYRDGKLAIKALDDSKSEFQEKVLKDFQYVPKLSISVSRKRIFDYTGQMIEKIYDAKPLIQINARRIDYLKIRAFLEEKLSGVAGGIDNFEFKEQLLETFTVPLGDKCAVCSAAIDSTKRHYWSFHKKEHVCRDCAEFEDKSKELFGERFKYHHNLVVIEINGNTKLLENIDEHKFGKDTQPPLEDKFTQEQTYGCDGCSGSPPGGLSTTGFRYICITCRPGPMWPGGYKDFCNACFTVSHNAEHPEHEEHLKKYKNDGHDIDHLLLRILTDAGGYYDF